MYKILIVDDNQVWRESLSEMLEESGYTTSMAATGEEAVRLLESGEPYDLIVSDLLLPGMDGFELCRYVRESSSLPKVPFIFCSGFFPAEEQKSLAKLLEVEEFFDKPVDFDQMFAVIEKILSKNDDKEESGPGKGQAFSKAHTELIQSKLWKAVERERRQKEVAEALALQLKKNLESFIAAVAKAVEARDPYTAGHQRRVAMLADAIGRELSLSSEQLNAIHFGSLIHDIGKVHVPSELLVKPTALSEIEFEMIKTHAEVGYDILKDIDSPWPIAEIAYQHHERVNGTGYPRGLKGDEIIPEAKVVIVADVVEAMMSHRPYRAALGEDAAIKEITRNRGEFYDSGAVDACLRVFEKGFQFDEQTPSDAETTER